MKTRKHKVNQMDVLYGIKADIDSWMRLVESVSWNFPGLETKAAIEEHRQTVCKFMQERQALCVKVQNEVVGVMLFSRSHNMICCLAVSPAYRKQGIASLLLERALAELDRSKNITVSTFREDDEKGHAPRALYQKFGFQEDALIEAFGYPSQVFVLNAQN